MKRCSVAILLTIALSLPFPSQAADAPALMLAQVYHRADVDLSAYMVSEKYDGVRGYWDGERLLTRGGEVVHAPDWFTSGWPKMALDGELWVGRGRFAAAVSTVRQQQPDDAAWRKIRFMVFDLPNHTGAYNERDAHLARVVASIGQPWVKHVAQLKVANDAALRSMLHQVVHAGGEGLVLHRADSFYAAGRSIDLLKLKPYIDADARVVGYVAGKGKYAGVLGALLVESDAGLRFRLGSGLSDELRRTPPPIGSWVSYRYNGVNEKTGIPRFARFLRVRPDLSP